MKESDIELDCKKLAEAMGWAVYKGFGRKGAPDKIFLKDGAGFTVEMKKPNKNELDPDQVIEQDYLTARRVPYYLVNSLESFREAILKEEDKLIRRYEVC